MMRGGAELALAALSTMMPSAPESPTMAITEVANYEARTPASPATRRRGSKKTPSVEKLYADLVKAGLVKIVRRRGKPPLIVWL